MVTLEASASSSSTSIAAAAAAGGGVGVSTSTALPAASRVRHQSSNRGSEFLELNVRELFENSTVERTVDIQKRLGVEIERKKEEMRILVGERYRDLIDAADTIGGMKSNSSEIFNKLVELRTKLSAFPVLLSSRTGLPDQLSSKPSLGTEELEIACKLKFSQEIPRQIQLLLQKQNVVTSLHCYLLYSKKVQDVLTTYDWTFLEQNEFDMSKSVDASALKSLILNICDKAMREHQTSSEKLTECIIVTSVLNTRSCEATLQNFLELRVIHCQSILSEQPDYMESTYSVEDEVVKYISKTLLNLYQIFIDPELYNSISRAIRQPKVCPLSLGFVGVSAGNCSKALQDFNRERIPVDDPPRIGKLTELILIHFLPQLQQLLIESYRNGQYMNKYSSLKELVLYKSKSNERLQLECESLTKILFGSNQLKKSLWNELFQEIFELKCQAIVRKKVESIFQSISFEKYKQADSNFNCLDFVWKNQSLSSLLESFTENKSELELLLKLKGLTPNVAFLCEEFELSVKDLLEDFLAVNNGFSSATVSTSSLKEFISTTIVHNFLEFLNAKKENENAEITSNNLFIARALVGFIELNPTVWKILEKQDAVTLKQTFWSTIEWCWTRWSKSTLNCFHDELSLRIPRLLDPNVIIELMPVGETYKPPVEEGNEQLQPSIRVPIQLSHILHSLLFKFCQNLATVGPQSIPKSVRDLLRENLGQIVVDFYHSQLVQGNEPRLSAQLAVQFVFDIKFVQWFHPKLGTGNEQVESILKKLQSTIDPFDWDIIGGKLNGNLKRFLFENHLILGLLFSEESHTFIAQNFKTKQNQTYPTANRGLLAALPLLPI